MIKKDYKRIVYDLRHANYLYFVFKQSNQSNENDDKISIYMF